MTDSAKLDAGLLVALQRYERDKAASGPDASISVIVRFRDDIAALEALGFKPATISDDEAVGTIRFADIPRLAAHPNVIQISAGVRKRINLDTAIRDVHARASTVGSIGTDGLWHVDVATGVLTPAAGGHTGKDVIVAVIDTGIDITHPMFNKAIAPGYDSRILSIWDQGLFPSAGEAGPDKDLLLSTATYGVEFKTPAINSALNGSLFPLLPLVFNHRDCVGHGTHVASTAAGGPVFANSADAAKVGVAPEADIIMVKMLDVPDLIVDVNFNMISPSVQFRDAVIYCLRIAKSANKPIVINCSFGTVAEAGDGLDADSVWLDKTFDPSAAADDKHFPKGAVLVKSAGNEGKLIERAHAKVTVPDTGKIIIPFDLFEDRGPNRTDVVNCVRESDVPSEFVFLWYRDVAPPQDVSVRARVPTEATFSDAVFAGSLSKNFDGAKTRALFHVTVPPVQRPDGSGGTVAVHRNNIFLRIDPNDRPTPPQHRLGIYELQIEAPPGTVLFAFCNRTPYHGFRVATRTRDNPGLPEAQIIAGSAQPILPIEVTEFGTHNTDAGSRHIITAAAYDDTDGDVGNPLHHSLASFSSRGPLRDFSNPPLGPLADKPEVAAPGVEINAALSKDMDNNLLNLFDFSFQQGNRFVAFEGTSMSAPIVSGVIALMLQKKPDMSVSDVRAILTAPANVNPGKNPAPGDPGFTEGFGAGRIDALKSHTAT